MEKEMLEIFIYYVLALEKQGSQNYTINGCIKKMEIALKFIKIENLAKWNESLENFPESHPIVKKQRDLMNLTQEEYIEMLIKVQKLMKKYSLCGGTLNYDSLYLIKSEKDVEKLAYQIILKSDTTSTIKQKIGENVKGQNSDKKELGILIDELCLRYYYGIDVEKNYSEAVKGWEMVSEYINDAKYMLGICYKKGTGVNQDREKAYKIFNEISDDIRAKYQIALMNFMGIGTKQNHSKAFEIFSELKGKSPYDMDKWIDSYMGEMHYYGLGIKQDKEKGLALMENAWYNGIALNYKNIKKVLQDYYNSK